MFALFRLGVTLGKTSNSDKGDRDFEAEVVKEVLATGGELDSDEGKTLAPDGEDGVLVMDGRGGILTTDGGGVVLVTDECGDI